MKLSDFAYNRFSQFGEDGIIEKIFEVIGVESRVCIEFGAWDGLHLSNTANLWKNGWEGILIEADSQKYELLLKNTAGSKCHCIHQMVGVAGDHTLERILRSHQLDSDVDFLSIDIDGDDYHVFASVESLEPRVICCEYNPTIPAHIDLVPETGNYFGCSVSSLVKLAESKGYYLIALTETNCFFVPKSELPKFSGFVTALEDMLIVDHITYVMTGYNGDYVFSRKPTYGHRKPTEQAFRGEYYTPVADSIPNRSVPSLRFVVSALLRKAGLKSSRKSR